MKKLLKILLAIALAAGLLYWCFRQVQGDLFLSSLRQARWYYLFPAFCVSLVIVALNSIQWKLFLPQYNRVSFGKMFELISIFSMTVNLLPFWGGHALMVYLLGHREKVGKTIALSALTLDQIVEGPAKLLLFGIVFLIGPFPAWMQEGMRGFFLLVILGYIVLLILAFRFRVHPDQGPIHNAPRWSLIRGLVARWAHHLHTLRNWKRLLFSVLLAVLMKFLEVAAVYFIQKSLQLPLGWSAAFLVTAAVSLATTLPLTPGRLGLFEAAAMLAYQYLSVPSGTALALGVMIHAAHTLPFILAGYLSSVKIGFSFEERAKLISQTV
jgi:glycosyltransferase 2 family protein